MRLYYLQIQTAFFFITQSEKAQETETQVRINIIGNIQASRFKGHLS